MGACMCPPQLAIITSFCKGKPLFNLLHVHKEKFNLTKISNIAKHISLVSEKDATGSWDSIVDGISVV